MRGSDEDSRHGVSLDICGVAPILWSKSIITDIQKDFQIKSGLTGGLFKRVKMEDMRAGDVNYGNYEMLNTKKVFSILHHFNLSDIVT